MIAFPTVDEDLTLRNKQAIHMYVENSQVANRNIGS
jgi:hypothetical protein